MSFEKDRLDIVTLHREKERLRSKHNVMGEKCKSGKIRLSEWRQYLDNEFTPESNRILGKIGLIENQFREKKGFTNQKLTDKKIVYPQATMSDGEKLHYLLYLGQCLENDDSLREGELHLKVSKATRNLRRGLRIGE